MVLTQRVGKIIPVCRLNPGRNLRSLVPDAVAAADAMQQYFKLHYSPVLLDGSLPRTGERRVWLRQARQSLDNATSLSLPLPAPILREILATIHDVSLPTTKSGLTAISPRQAQVWWDPATFDDDILACLDQPRPVLRFYDVTGLDPEAGRWNQLFDVDVTMSAGGHTMQSLCSDHTYVVDLGYVYADGRFLRLARTNAVCLPRDGRGKPFRGEMARCTLQHRADAAKAKFIPDALAQEWVGCRPDTPGRDINAELTMHMLYREFLHQGTRVLRNAPQMVRRDSRILQREYVLRSQMRERTVPGEMNSQKYLKKMLVVPLDVTPRQTPPLSARYSLLPVLATSAWKDCLDSSPECFIACTELRLLTSGVAPYVVTLDRIFRLSPTVKQHHPASLVRTMPITADLTASVYSAPVFAAARKLHSTLRGVSGTHEGLLLARNTVPAPLPSMTRVRTAAVKGRFSSLDTKEMTRAGVRFTRASLVLEGKVQPGSRLRVAGKLVQADAKGNFRVECALAGRKVAIPLRAGVTAGGEAQSMVTVDWAGSTWQSKNNPCGIKTYLKSE